MREHQNLQYVFVFKLFLLETSDEGLETNFLRSRSRANVVSVSCFLNWSDIFGYFFYLMHGNCNEFCNLLKITLN